jgi:hypothetical protein
MSDYRSKLAAFTDMFLNEYVSFHEFVNDPANTNDRFAASRMKTEIPQRVIELRKRIIENPTGFSADVEYQMGTSRKPHRKDMWIRNISISNYLPRKIKMNLDYCEGGINDAIREGHEWGNMRFSCYDDSISFNDGRTRIIVPEWFCDFLGDMNISLKTDDKTATEYYIRDGVLDKIHVLRNRGELSYLDIPLVISCNEDINRYVLTNFLVPVNMNNYRNK